MFLNMQNLNKQKDVPDIIKYKKQTCCRCKIKENKQTDVAQDVIQPNEFQKMDSTGLGLFVRDQTMLKARKD